MKKIKLSRYESQIIDIINRAILFDVHDKIAKFGRVTYVELTNDLSFANCYIDCLDRNKIDQVIKQLNKLSGLFRNKIAKQFNTYKTPVVKFFADKTIDYAKNIDTIIKSIKKEEE